MPFNLGKSKKGRQAEEDAPSDEAVEEIADSAALEPEVEEAVETGEETQTAPDEAREPDAEPVQEEDAGEAAHRGLSVPSFRPSFLDPDTSERPRERSPDPPARQAPRGGPFFVSIRDEAGELSVQRFDERKDAEAHIELLLEEGVDAGAIAVHRGLEVACQVTRRPVVQLVNPDPQ